MPTQDPLPESLPEENSPAACSASPAPDAVSAASGMEAFARLGLSAAVLDAVAAQGYERPTPIQAQAIPVLLQGRDLIGQAQTGTGKTAAFALPLLSHFQPHRLYALVLEPTRELALQVAQAFQNCARFIDGFQVLPVYGGAPYQSQLRALRHGVSVIVATPGRLIDLMERSQADCSQIHCVVLDEADEMLRMGFIDDVRWILERLPADRQSALFSATLPEEIRSVAHTYLREPEEVRIATCTAPASTVRQRYWVVSGAHKIDAISRMLEVEDYDAVLVFVRTKTDAEEVANRLLARGLACVALHGDIPQKQREKIIERLRQGYADIIIATDVAARGLDIERISHVFNYDIPYDAETYVHRIGRTGRAGRSGEAIVFVTPRERRLLRQIERTIGRRLEPMVMPSVAEVNKSRLESFKNQILEVIENDSLERYQEVISDILANTDIETEVLAAALAKLSQKNGELFWDEKDKELAAQAPDEERQRRGAAAPRTHFREISAIAAPLSAHPGVEMARYRIAVGRRDGVRPSQIVGAIANEGQMGSDYIGEIHIYDTFCTVDLPAELPHGTLEVLGRARVCGRAMELREYTREPPARSERRKPERRERGTGTGHGARTGLELSGGRRDGLERAARPDGSGARYRTSGKPGYGRPYRGQDPLSSIIRTKKGRF